ncbi:MAG: ABC transporter substrate-binding protein [Chitinophagaceae bacterium]|nr:ABC transporter substrate-binding protein [Chitinophagaceae bacterium]
MPAFIDQLDRTIFLDHPPRRIISLVPSQTELLYTLGLEEEVVGITKFCVHPAAWHHSKTRVGGTKNIHADIIRTLQPDLIIANKEENQQEQIEQLFLHYPVWISDITTLDDALEMIRAVGMLTGRTQTATSLADDIRQAFQTSTTPSRPLRTAYFIWKDPWMAAGGNTFIQHMLERCGLVNVFSDRDRYPIVQPEELLQKDCELVLLSSEPYPFREKHVAEITPIIPSAAIRLVDGEMFSWYGSRLLKSPAYFRQLRKHLQENSDI